MATKKLPQIPQIYTVDALAEMGDGELYERGAMLHADMKQAVKYGVSPRPWEIELAYVQRELDIRKTRKIWCAEHPEVMTSQEEVYFDA